MMIGVRFAGALLLAGFISSQAAAADLSLSGPRVIYERPFVSADVLIEDCEPYYLVDQGPDFSGPGVVIGPRFLLDTDVQLLYPAVDMFVPVHRGWSRWRRPHRHEIILRRLGAAGPAALSARAEALPTDRRGNVHSRAGARPAWISDVFAARSAARPAKPRGWSAYGVVPRGDVQR